MHGQPSELAWRRADARQLTQALGVAPDDQVNPSIAPLRIETDSLFLLCTDGVSDGDFVEQQADMLLFPLLEPGADLAAGCNALVETANERNGHDNLTAILVRLKSGRREGLLGAPTVFDGVPQRAEGGWFRRLWRKAR